MASTCRLGPSRITGPTTALFRVVQDRKLLEGLNVGDVVTITYTRAQAVSIARAQ